MILFTLVLLLSILIAAFSSGLRQAILSLWVAGFALGCIYISLGAELAAIVQWMVSTILAISFIFFSVMFGEYDGKQKDPVRLKLKPVLAGLISLGFIGLIFLCARGFGNPALDIPSQGGDLSSFGNALLSEHFLTLEILALILFLITLAGGVIARPARSQEPGLKERL